MKRTRIAAVASIGFATFALTLTWLARFWAEDGCLDLGGAIVDRLCDSPTGLVPLNYSFTVFGWLVLSLVATMPAALVAAITSYVLGRHAA